MLASTSALAALALTLSSLGLVSAAPAPIYNVKNAVLPAADSATESYWVATGPAYLVPAVRFYNGTDGSFTGGREPTPSASLVAPTYPAAKRQRRTASGLDPRNPKRRIRRSNSRQLVGGRSLDGHSSAVSDRVFEAGDSTLPIKFSFPPPGSRLSYQQLMSYYSSLAAAQTSPALSSTSLPQATTSEPAAETSAAQIGVTTLPATTAAPSSTPMPATTTTTQAPGTSAPTPTTAVAPSPPRTTPLASWKQKTYFYSLASFLENVVDKQRWTWGSGNVAVLGKGVPASEWKNGMQLDTDSALQVAYPKGSRNPSATPVGGMGFYSSKLDISSANNVSFSYSVFFPNDFDFVKGGKLPGLYGGDQHGCSGGSSAETCFSARLMFRTGGMGELYLYAPREKQVDALCTLGPLSYCNSVYGMSIGRGSWTFERGAWSNIRQDIWLNTPGKPDGGFNIWVNDKLVLHSDSVYYRNSAAGLTSNGTGAGPNDLPLIDYDSLPDDLAIPNGGFQVHPLANSTAPATAAVLVASAAVPAADLATQTLALRKRERRRISWPGTSLVKRATANLSVPSFSGAMCQTFFGGSTSSWNSPKLQYSYFRGLRMQINA